MLVGDIIYNDSFDFNGNYAVYDVSDGRSWQEQKFPVASTYINRVSKPLDRILDMEIVQVTISNLCLIIEAKNKNK